MSTLPEPCCIGLGVTDDIGDFREPPITALL